MPPRHKAPPATISKKHGCGSGIVATANGGDHRFAGEATRRRDTRPAPYRRCGRTSRSGIVWRVDGKRVAEFRTTRWSVVVAAQGGATPDARTALETLCGAYWYPLYAFARRRGHDESAAQDAVQGFLARLIGQRTLAAADRERGRFRTFLLTCFSNFICNEVAREAALKRGGGSFVVSLSGPDAERRFALEPIDDVTPERLFERDWAITVLERVLDRLRTSYRDRGKEALFGHLKETLAGATDVAYADRAQAIGMSEGAFKVAVHRIRARYRDALRSEIADTLSDGERIEDEIAALFRALAPV